MCLCVFLAISWPGFTKCHPIVGTTLLLPTEATGATRGWYLALSKAWQSVYTWQTGSLLWWLALVWTYRREYDNSVEVYWFSITFRLNGCRKNCTVTIYILSDDQRSWPILSANKIDIEPGWYWDQWCLQHILQIPFTAHVTNQEVRIRSAQPPVTQTITARRLRFFGHIVRSVISAHFDQRYNNSDEDHTRALNAGIDDPPKDWRRPRGRPRQTWLRTVEKRPQTSEPGSVVCPAQSI